MSHHDDFDIEPVKGLPQLLPEGERMLWQGAPRWQDLAVHAFHARKVLWYFIAIALIQAAWRYADGATLAAATKPFLWLIPMGLVVSGVLAALAYASAATTVYTMTTKRLVMRIGMAYSVSLNVPFKQVDGAAVRLFANGSGDIPLKLAAGERVAFILLWPHARPFQFRNPQPALRCIPDADKVASLLAAALNGEPAAPLVPAGARAASRPSGATPVPA